MTENQSTLLLILSKDKEKGHIEIFHVFMHYQVSTEYVRNQQEVMDFYMMKKNQKICEFRLKRWPPIILTQKKKSKTF